MAHDNGNGHTPTWSLTFGSPPPDPRTARGSWITLGDGNRWLVPPLNFHDRIVHEDDVLLPAFADLNYLDHAAACLAFGRLLHLVMQRNYPGMPEEFAQNLIDYETLPELVPLLMMQNRVHFRELLTKIGLSPPPSSDPTGTPSTSPSADTSDGLPPS